MELWRIKCRAELHMHMCTDEWIKGDPDGTWRKKSSSSEKMRRKGVSNTSPYANIFLSIIIFRLWCVCIHTVSVVLSKRSDSRYHVITAGGREPALWHDKSYRRPAERGWFWCAPNKRILSGATGRMWMWEKGDKRKGKKLKQIVLDEQKSDLLMERVS